MTAVDRCETEIDAAMEVNGTAVGHMASACNEVGSTLVQLSTDYVFRGNGEGAYSEDDPTDPVTVYGLSLIHISEPTRPFTLSRMPSSA